MGNGDLNSVKKIVMGTSVSCLPYLGQCEYLFVTSTFVYENSHEHDKWGSRMSYDKFS